MKLLQRLNGSELAMRTQADFENYRKRATNLQHGSIAQQSAPEALLPVLDATEGDVRHPDEIGPLLNVLLVELKVGLEAMNIADRRSTPRRPWLPMNQEKAPKSLSLRCFVAVTCGRAERCVQQWFERKTEERHGCTERVVRHGLLLGAGYWSRGFPKEITAPTKTCANSTLIRTLGHCAEERFKAVVPPTTCSATNPPSRVRQYAGSGRWPDRAGRADSVSTSAIWVALATSLVSVQQWPPAWLCRSRRGATSQLV